MKKRIAKNGIITIVLVFLLSITSNVYAIEVYTNQVGKFNYYSNAIKLKRSLESKGFKVYMSEGPPYLVTVERSFTYSEALQIKERLNRLNINSFIIKINGEKEKSTIAEKSDIKAINIFPLLEDSIFRGVHGSQTLFFYINENWEPDGSSYVDLHFSHSPVSTEHKSTLTVYVNDRPINSFELVNEKMMNRTVRVAIPKDVIAKGFNTLMVRLYKRISDRPCEDLYNPGNWFRLNKDTMIHIEYREMLDNTNLSDYPYPYFKIGRENPVDSIIVLPDNYSSRHLTAAAYLAAGFGKYEPYKNLQIKVETEQGIKKYLEHSNLIFIGNTEEFENIDSLPPIVEEKEAGILEEFISPWNSSKKLLRIAGEGTSIKEAAKALFYSNLVNQMKRKRQVMRDIEGLFDEMNSLGDKITLADLGYNDIIVKGVYQQVASFRYSLPAGMKLKEGAGITLDLRYSQALDFIQSSVTVMVNDIPIGSKKLTPEGAEGERVSFKFTPELIEEEDFSIRVLFFLDLRNIDCNQRYENQAWAVIGNSSFLYLPHEDGDRKTLKNYHSIFSNNGRLVDTVVVIPDNPRVEDIEMALNLFAYMGHYLKSLGDVELVKAEDFTVDRKNKNVILIGIPQDNSYIKSINQYLWVKFDESYTRLVPNENFPFLEELGRECGIVQLINSPWSQGKKVMVVTGVNYFSLKNAELMLTSINIAPTLSGTVSMMDNTGEVYNFESMEKAGTIQKNEEDKFGKLFWFQKLHELFKQRDIKILVVMLGLIITIMIILFYAIKKNYR